MQPLFTPLNNLGHSQMTAASQWTARGMRQELTTERIVAEADLKKQLGTLRYLQGLKAARQRLAAAAQGTGPFIDRHAVKRICINMST